MAEQEMSAGQSHALERLLEARTQELAALEEAAHVLETLSHSPPEGADLPAADAAMPDGRGGGVYVELNRQAAGLLNAAASAILLYDPQRQALVPQLPVYGLPDEVIGDYCIPVGGDSPVRALWEGGLALAINDVPNDPLVRSLGYDGQARRVGIQSTLIVALRHEGVALGAIQVSNKRDGSGFDADDQRLIAIFAGQAAVTLQYARLLERSERQAEELASLYAMAAALAGAADLGETLDTVLKGIRRVLDYDLCFIALASDDEQALHIHAVDALSPDDAAPLLHLDLPLDRGINAWIYRHGRPTLVDDANLDSRRLHVGGVTEHIRAAVGAPLLAEGRAVGTIYATRREPNAFTPAHLRFLTVTAAQVAAAVQRARLLDQARTRAQEMETLSSVGAVIASSLDLEQILKAIYEQAGRIMDTAAFFVALYDAETQELCFDPVFDAGQQVDPFTLPLDTSQGLTAHVIRTGQPLLVRNMEQERDTLPAVPVIRGSEPVSWLGVPIVAQDRILGVISAQSYRPYAFTADQAAMLQAIANQAGIALQNTRLYAAARQALGAAAAERDRLVHLHSVVVEVQRRELLRDRLQTIANGIGTVGWGRVTVSLRDADLNAVELVCAGFRPEDEAALRANLLPGSEWKKRFTGEFERFRLGQCYYLPFSDPWVRETIRGVKSHLEPGTANTWHPQDLLYVPLSGRKGRIIGIIGLDDPLDGQRPTAESLHIIELFAQEVALTIENAELLSNLKLLNADLQEMLDTQARLLHTVEELASPVVPVVEGVIVLPLIGHIDDRRAGQILDTLLGGIEQYQARVALLDITGVAVVDTRVAHHLIQSVAAARLLGAEAILVGIRPDVAQALTALGVNLRDVVTRSNLQSGFQYALSLIGQRLGSSK